MVENEALWYQVISRKYRVEEGRWYTGERKEGFDVGFNYIGFSVGNGRRIRFWLDPWCAGEVLCNSFPSLFALAISKEKWVAEVWDSSVEEGVRVLVFLGLSMIGK
ncbi:hypothetical protein AAG906_001843 [Vitis piasezkii]